MIIEQIIIDGEQQRRQEEEELYDYLLMKFWDTTRSKKLLNHLKKRKSNQITGKNIKLIIAQYPQLNQLSLQSQSQFCGQQYLPKTLIQLFTQQKIIENNWADQLPQKTPFSEGNLSALDQKFAKKLTQFYPQLFCFQDFKGTLFNIQKLQDLLYQIVKNQTISKILFSDVTSQQIQFKVQLNNQFNAEMGFFIACAIIKQEQFHALNEQTQLKIKLQMKLASIVKEIVQKCFECQKQANINLDSQILITNKLSKYLQRQDTLYFHQIILISKRIQKQKLYKQLLLKKYQQFKQYCLAQEQDIDDSIFQLHYLKEIISFHNYQIQHQMYPSLNHSFFQQSNKKLKTSLEMINVLNYFTENKKFKIQLNINLLKLFLKYPYQTSLFILSIFLENSNIKNVKKFFTLKKGQVFVDPTLFFLINENLINNLNAQTLSFSLWIVTIIWLKYTEKKVKQKVQMNIQNQKGLQSSQINQQIVFGDPRRIYSIRQESYKMMPSLSNQKNPANIHLKQINSIKQFNSKFKKPLLYTISIFLLTLNVETTMLKYFIIQNDLIKQMLQGDLLPDLLIKNKYILQNQFKYFPEASSMPSALKHQEEEQILRKIQNVNSLKQLRELEQQFQQLNTKKTKNNFNKQIQYTSSQFSQGYNLPWMSLIQSKQVLSELIRKPFGYQLALKIIERHPHTFEKLFQNLVTGLLVFEVERYLKKNKIKQNNPQNYKFKGNKNIKCKKSIDYSGKTNNSENKSQANQDYLIINEKEQKQKFRSIKNILKIYKEKSKDPKTKRLSEQLIAILNQ